MAMYVMRIYYSAVFVSIVRTILGRVLPLQHWAGILRVINTFKSFYNYDLISTFYLFRELYFHL